MVDYGVVLGALGIATGLASLAYARGQTHAARAAADAAMKQAAEANRAASFDASRDMLANYLAIRNRRFTNPTSLAAIRKASPDVAALLDEVGGAEVYLLYRELADTFQSIYHMRVKGLVSDEDWYVWTEQHMGGPPLIPEFERVYRFAVKAGWMQPDFAKWYENYFGDGPSPPDPKRA
ncbi:MAG: hypothetical protein ACYDCK_13905 [Thermoplasmatota archaeon]